MSILNKARNNSAPPPSVAPPGPMPLLRSGLTASLCRLMTATLGRLPFGGRPQSPSESAALPGATHSSLHLSGTPVLIPILFFVYWRLIDGPYKPIEFCVESKVLEPHSAIWHCGTFALAFDLVALHRLANIILLCFKLA